MVSRYEVADLILAKREPLVDELASEFQLPGRGELHKSSYFYSLLAFLILSAVYASGVMKSQVLPVWVGDYPSRPINERPHFDRTSDSLVENVIYARLLEVESRPGGFLISLHKDPRRLDVENIADFDGNWIPSRQDFERQDSYRSNFGLQGRVYAAVADGLNLSPSLAVRLLRALNAILLAAMLTPILLLFRREWGLAAGLSGLAFCAVSTGFNLFAPSLYWITFIHVAPTSVISLAVIANVGSRLLWAGVYGLVLILFTIKFLSGYEFMTATVGSAAMPFLLLYSIGKMDGRAVIARMAVVGAIGLLAFLLSLAIFHAHYRATFGESGIAFLLSRTDEWTAPPVRPFLDAGQVMLINFVDYDGFAMPALIFFAAAGVVLFRALLILVCRGLDSQRDRFILAMAGVFLVSASWMVLQPKHISIHPQYSTILFAFPFGIFLAAGTGRLLAHRSRGRTPRLMRQHKGGDLQTGLFA